MVLGKLFLAAVISWFLNMFILGSMVSLINIPIPGVNLLIQAVVFGVVVIIVYEILGRVFRRRY
jgi:hypothetical protein